MDPFWSSRLVDAVDRIARSIGDVATAINKLADKYEPTSYTVINQTPQTDEDTKRLREQFNGIVGRTNKL